jgi:hypothetical protein
MARNLVMLSYPSYKPHICNGNPQESLVKKQQQYRKKMKENSMKRVRWDAFIAMEVIGRNPKRMKSETNKVKGSQARMTASTFKFPGTILDFVGADSCSVRWGEKGGPRKEHAGEVSVVKNYFNNLRPRRTPGGDEFVRFDRRNGASKMREGVSKQKPELVRRERKAAMKTNAKTGAQRKLQQRLYPSDVEVSFG